MVENVTYKFLNCQLESKYFTVVDCDFKLF